MSARIKFKGGWAEGLTHQTAQHMGGPLTPSLVILHDTASRLEAGNAAGYLAQNDAKVSVHFVVERDGTIVQQVPIDRVAYHAGRSVYHGRQGCNGFALGIEIVNPGALDPDPNGARSWWGDVFDLVENGISFRKLVTHGARLWMPYTPEQLEAVLKLLGSLFLAVPTLRDIRTHWYVSPGRKVDTNPLFPLEAIRARILGRDDPALDDADAVSTETERTVTTHTPGDTLNLRAWPSFNPNVLVAIPHGTVLPVEREGVFEGRRWLRVRYGGAEGWITELYTRPGPDGGDL